MSTNFKKDPDAILDYINDWSDWLDGDTISTSTWTAEEGITVVSSTESNTTSTVWLSGGSVGTMYLVTNRIVTTAGRTDDRSIHIRIIQR